MKQYSIKRYSSDKWEYNPGSMINLSVDKIKTEDPAAEDRKNRNQVVHEIEELVDKGMPIEEACKNLVEKHKDKFKYFAKEELAPIFARWYNGRHKSENKSIEDRTC